MNKLKFEEPTTKEQNDINEALTQDSRKKVPFTQDPPQIAINRVIKDGDEVVGGIMAEASRWHILKIETLWVHESHRGKGYGTSLMKEVEKVAIKLGCKLSQLSTFGFQGKEFYEKAGYRVFGILENCPEGHNRYYLSKRLECESARKGDLFHHK